MLTCHLYGSKSYNEILSTTIVKSWQKVWPKIKEIVVNNDDQPSLTLKKITDQQNKENYGETAENKDEAEELMSQAEGKSALQLAATYIKQQNEATTVDVLLIKKW